MSAHLDQQDIAALGCDHVPKGILEPMTTGVALNKVKDFEKVKASEATRTKVQE